jgi:uncharacterized membrane protein
MTCHGYAIYHNWNKLLIFGLLNLVIGVNVFTHTFQTKTQMVKEYEKDLEDYKKIKELYEKSLTEEQKENIKKVKVEIAEAREKRKLKAVSP